MWMSHRGRDLSGPMSFFTKRFQSTSKSTQLQAAFFGLLLYERANKTQLYIEADN